MSRKTTVLILIVSFVLIMLNCGENKMERQFKTFLAKHLLAIQPLQKEMNLKYWEAAITGKKENYDIYADREFKLRKIYSDSTEFALIKSFRESGDIKNELYKRQLDLLYNSYLSNQIEPGLLKKIVQKSSEVENKFSVFRGTVGTATVSDNEIKSVLKTETDSKMRRDYWLASKQVGVEIEKDLIELVKLRNQAAVKLGYDNYYIMSLELGEQNVEELNNIFDELADLTDEPFAELKNELDAILADNLGIGVGGMMPWHYHDPFFQEGPLVYNVDLDKYYEDQNIKELVENFYSGINLQVGDILERSDLYEKEGKNPHAFCTDIDREGDIRILCNLKNNEGWTETLLHELGHAVYDKYIDPDLPFLIREPAHSFTTEAIAMLFGRLSRNAYWLQEMIGLDDKERDEIAGLVQKSLTMKQLVFARWCQVMFRFEQKLYEDPDQDLNTLWWDLVEKYQYIKRPINRNAPDWAAKIHFTIAPVYYHNYMLGELLASQLHSHIVHEVLGLDNDTGISYINQKKIGSYLKKKVFAVGSKYPWNEMIKNATGEYLTAKYFVDQFVE
ncbi:hypothetical protein B6I21_03085 [candidate division KSB1 bacterium 4572_119]|nr:MAG: hypothetical protein B6I21_03085 [candidate division KSB1 bacterium 4572_119]